MTPSRATIRILAYRDSASPLFQSQDVAQPRTIVADELPSLWLLGNTAACYPPRQIEQLHRAKCNGAQNPRIAAQVAAVPDGLFG